MRAIAWPAAVAVLLAVCACGSGPGRAAGPATSRVDSPAGTVASGRASSAPAAATPASATPAGAASSCGDPAAPSRLVTIRTGDHVRLAGFEAGAGSRGVVLVPEAGSAGKCGWWPYAAYLAQRGFHVLAFDHRCQGSSDCPAGGAARDPGQELLPDIAAAVRTLRGAGASKIALLGASQGGSEVLIAAGRPSGGPDSVAGVAAVAALSADELDQQLAPAPGPRTALAAAATVRVPVLLAVAPDDPYVSLTETRTVFAALGTPAAGKRLLVQPAGAGHGWLMLEGASAGAVPPLASQLAAFLKAVTT
jgi:alpha-beta hydrolase superfamily lysophospholipase